MKIFIFITIILSLYCSKSIKSEVLISENNCQKYTVLENENIVFILKKHSLYPIFGKEGSLAKTYKLQSKNKNENKNLVYKGDVICLPQKNNITINIKTIENKKIDNVIPKIENNPKENIEQKNISTKICQDYTIHKGDTLFTILREKKLFPIFGKIGSLEATLKLNSLSDKDIKNLKINSNLCLPFKNNLIANKINEENHIIENTENIKENEILKLNYEFNPILNKENKENFSPNEKKEIRHNKIITENKNKNIKTKKINENKKTDDKIKQNLQSEPVANLKCMEYKTKEGESLIEILRSQKRIPIYGINGSFNQTLSLNPNIKKNNPKFKEGEVICLESIQKSQTLENSLVQEKQEDKDNSNHMVYFEGGGKYLRLIEKDNDNGTSAKLLSRLMISVEGGLIQKWTPSLYSYFGINFGVTQIMQSDTSVVIGDDIIRLTNYFLGIKYYFFPDFYGNMEYGYGDALLFRAINSNTMQVEKMATAKIKILGGYTFLNFEKLKFNGEAAFLINTPFNNEIYASQIGTGYEAAFVSSYETKDWEVRARLHYSRYITNIPPVTFDYTEIGILLRLSAYLPQ